MGNVGMGHGETRRTRKTREQRDRGTKGHQEQEKTFSYSPSLVFLVPATPYS